MIKTWFSIDRITALELGKSAEAFVNVPNTLSIFATHFPRFPVLPGVLILSTLAELSRLLLEKQTGKKWRLVGAEQIRFRHFVQPGDQMLLTVELKEQLAESALLTGTVKVRGKTMVTSRQIKLVSCSKEDKQ